MTARRSQRAAQIPPAAWLIVVLAIAVAFIVGVWLGGRWAVRPAGEPPPARPSDEGGEAARSEPAERVVAPGQRPVAPPARGARIGLVVDDLGRSLRDLDVLAALGVPLSYAVLPYETRTAEVVAAHRRGAEVLLHLPMEPSNGADPGPGALTREMGPVELAAATERALANVPGAVGVNNHMGSGLTPDEEAMRAVLAVVAERDLFFLDSRTSSDTLGFRLARRAGVAAAEREVFLDGVLEPEAVREQFRRLLELARADGAAIAIGHPHPVTLRVLAEEVPRARELGYEFVRVSELLKGPAGRAGGEPAAP